MYCQHCGTKINDDSKFCMVCGEKIGNSDKSREDSPVRKKIYFKSYPIPKMIKPDLHDRSEEFYLECHPHFLYFNLFWWIFSALLSFFAVAFMIGDRNFVPLSILMLIIAFLFVIIPLLKWKHTIYALTSKRVLRISGVIGKDIFENKLGKIQDIRINIGILQRIMGCGTIVITTAGTAGVECVWEGIREPKKIQKILRMLVY